MRIAHDLVGSFCLAVLLAVPLAVPRPAMALDGVDFTVATRDGSLADALRAASPLIALENNVPEDILAAARAEYGRLIGVLYARGHYSAVISIRLDGREASGIAPLDAPARVSRIAVQVEPGPVFAFSRAVVAPLPPGTRLPEGFRPEAPAASGMVRDAVSAGVEAWRGEGHAKAAVTGEAIVADHRAATLSAEVRLTPGPRLRFGPVAVEGHERMREARVRKIAGLPEGQVFSPAEVTRAAERLRRTGTFRSVTITEAEQITTPDLLGMTVTVVEERPRRLSFGAEVSSLDGLDLTAAWMHRNLLGGAERLRVEGAISQIGAQANGMDYRLGLTIDRPATITPDTTLRFAAEVKREDEPDFFADSLNLGIGFAHVFSEDLTGRIDLSYRLSDGSFFSEAGRPIGRFNFRNLSLPIGLTWDLRNDRADPSRGVYLEAEVKPFLGFGSTGSGLRATADLRGYYGFGAEDRVVLAGRVQVGAVFGPTLVQTPRDDLFLSGGGGTVRGQPYQSLGIRFSRDAANRIGVADSFQIGGNRFLAASLEARVKATETIGVVGFVDAGRIDLDSFFDPMGEWHAGAGLGIRYATGVGPIRLDVAAPIHGRTGEGVQIYVGLGQAF